MKILFVTIGEPVIHENNDLRLHRTGLLCELISKNNLAEVLWITSSFNHFNKRFYEKKDKKINVNERLSIIMLKGIGYKRNISLNRFFDHYILQKKVKNLIKKLKFLPDVVISSYPTIGLSFEVVKFYKKQNIPVYIDYRDMWPEVFYRILPEKLKFISKIIFYPIWYKGNYAIKNAFGIISISKNLLEYAIKSHKRIRSSKDFVCYMAYKSENYAENELKRARLFFSKKIPTLEDTSKKHNFIFLGTFTNKGYNFYPILDYLKKISNIRIILCGSGNEEKKLKVRYSKEKNFYFPGYLNDKKIQYLLKYSSVGLCPYSESEDFQNTIPSKASVYLSKGLFCLSSIKKGEFPSILKVNKLGSTYDSNNEESIKLAVNNLLNFLNQSNYNKKRLIEFYEKNFESNKLYTDYFDKIKNGIES